MKAEITWDFTIPRAWGQPVTDPYSFAPDAKWAALLGEFSIVSGHGEALIDGLIGFLSCDNFREKGLSGQALAGALKRANATSRMKKSRDQINVLRDFYMKLLPFRNMLVHGVVGVRRGDLRVQWQRSNHEGLYTSVLTLADFEKYLSSWKGLVREVDRLQVLVMDERVELFSVDFRSEPSS